MSEPYRPSNGTEGDRFEEKFCLRCKEYVGDHCDINSDAFWNDIGDEDYPPEWIQDEAGPRCTAFKAKVKP